MNLEELNSEQKKAVKHINGPMLILAGAGSGKTKVLTSRVAYLIEQGINEEEILAITFTKKAASEMKSRIYKLIGSKSYDAWISTFHSFGNKILKDNYTLVDLDKNFTILDSDDSLTLIKKIMKDLNIDNKIINPRYVKSSISSAKNEMINAEEFKLYNKSFNGDIIAKIYKRYETELKSNNTVDFDDLLILPIIIFENYPKILEIYQEKYKYIMIDEYQDTNEAQYKLTKLLAKKYKNICVVGDNDQSIYSFRGANYKNILNFESDYKDCLVIKLEQNYRSTKNILECANSVIVNNVNRKDKNLWSSNNDGEKIKYHCANTEEDEVNFVVKEIKKQIENNISYDEMAIIYRTNAQVRIFESMLLKTDIPFKVVGGYYFYNRKEIKDLIAYLKLIYNDKDNISLLRVINYPKRNIGSTTISKLISKANEENTSIYDAIDSGKELIFKKIIEDLKELSQNLTITELIDKILDISGIRKELISEKSLEANIRLENLEEFKSITYSFEKRNGLVSLGEFLDEITLISDKEEYLENNECVTLMTMHAAKGLEFDCVFIVGVEENLLPHVNSTNSSEEIEEERRLMYVSITRAKKILYLSYSKKRLLYGQTSRNLVSRFFKEIDNKYLEKINNFDIYKEEKKEYTINKDVEYFCGEKIHNDNYGDGVIISMDDKFVEIAFANKYGIKKFIKGHSSIKKL